MEKHIILTAFGTTSPAKSTYDHLDILIKPNFPDCRIHWTYSSPTIRKNLTNGQNKQTPSLLNLLERLNRNPLNKVVIQSVHILPGYEFHRTVRETQRAAVPTAIGMPLLTTPADYQQITNCLMPLIYDNSDAAILVLGHGTSHPSWTAYPALENVLRRQAGARIFVAALEKYPDSAHVMDEIAAQGFKQVLIIPFLMVAGMHFQRDIISDNPISWKSRLAKRNISLKFHNQGLGMLPGVADIICDHIKLAFKSILD